MCDPVTMAVMAVGTAYMQMQQGKAEAAAIKQEAANNQNIANFNAQQNEVAATQSVRKGAQDASVIRENVRRANATGRARFSSAGLDADVGTPASLIDQNVQTGEYNAMNVARDAELEAMGFKNAAIGQRFEGEVGVSNARFKAKNAKRNGLMNAAGTLITGAANYGQSTGGFGGGGKFGGGSSNTSLGRIDWFK